MATSKIKVRQPGKLVSELSLIFRSVERGLNKINQNMATKADVADMATKADVKDMNDKLDKLLAAAGQANHEGKLDPATVKH
jgi:hypothetical protein